MTDAPESRARRALLDAAFRLVQTHDVAAITVTDLVAEARLSRPTFYQHFDDVPQAVADAFVERIESAFGESDAANCDADGGAFIAATVGALIAELDTNRVAYRRALAGASSHRAVAATIRLIEQRMLDGRLGARWRADADRVSIAAAGAVWLSVRWLADGGETAEAFTVRLVADIRALVPEETR